MDSDYRIEFKDFCDEFREIRDGVMSTVMNRGFLNAHWGLIPAGIMRHSSGADIYTSSFSNQTTPISDLSTSSSESLHAGFRDEEIKSNDPDQNLVLPDDLKEASSVALPAAQANQRSRKGHRKSR